MSDLEVQPNLFRHYGDIVEQVAVTVGAAGTVDQVATVAAVAPVFGVIGQEFLAGFAYAQANHFAAVSDLAEAYAATAVAAHNAADAYERTEAAAVAFFTLPASTQR